MSMKLLVAYLPFEKMVDFILKKESLNEDAIDQTIIESKIQKAIIDGFHSVW